MTLICVGIPSIDGKVCAQTMDSLMAEQLLGYDQGVHFLVLWELGCSMIGIARNKLMRKFLDVSQASAIVFVDSDISWAVGDLAKLAMRPEHVVGGTYRAKRDDLYFHVRGNPERVGDLYKVDGLPGGFMKISRHAAEALPAQHYTDENDQPMKDWFPVGMHNGQMFGEDYGFCRLWREVGDVFLDPSIQLRHHDGLKAYSGDPLAFLESL